MIKQKMLNVSQIHPALTEYLMFRLCLKSSEKRKITRKSANLVNGIIIDTIEFIKTESALFQKEQDTFCGCPTGVPFSLISRVDPVRPSACGRGRILPPRTAFWWHKAGVPFPAFLLTHRVRSSTISTSNAICIIT